MLTTLIMILAPISSGPIKDPSDTTLALNHTRLLPFPPPPAAQASQTKNAKKSSNKKRKERNHTDPGLHLNIARQTHSSVQKCAEETEEQEKQERQRTTTTTRDCHHHNHCLARRQYPRPWYTPRRPKH